MTLKSLLMQVDTAAERWLPLPSPHDESIPAWANLHGWDLSDVECQRLIVRQALLNSIACRVIRRTAGDTFVTPLDMLDIEAPCDLISTIEQEDQHSATKFFNFWGELYSTLIPQAQRRRIGQFWTDEQIAEWMVAWLLQDHPHSLVDVGCGGGNFLLKASRLLANTGETTDLTGLDISPPLLNVTLAAFAAELWRRPLAWPKLIAQNFLDEALPAGTDAVVCNPPYTRHHHIPPELKDRLQAFFKSHLRLDVSRQATLAFYFLLKLVAEMPHGARAAVIVPMEVLDARYGAAAKRALCQHTSLSAIVHFSPQMNAFRKVDVGASILLFKKGYEADNYVRHLTLNGLPTTEELLECLHIESTSTYEAPFGSLVVQPQDELLEVPKWFSIAIPDLSQTIWQHSGLVVPLKALAKVVRGIATGANDFFVLPTSQVKQRRLEPYVVRTLQRNREIQDIVLDEMRWQTLSDEGKGVWLLYLSDNGANEHPDLRSYLAEGETKGYHLRGLVQTRRRWYVMEQRDVPAIFFTILTRGNPRFILNQAGVRPLNMFSLIYPNRHVRDADAVDLLWALLNSSFSLSRLHSVSRTYGGNTLKVEPRELDNLPVVNPLALPDDTRARIKQCINEFYRHREASLLIFQINDLVEELLSRETLGSNRLSLPIQLQLLDSRGDYGETGSASPLQKQRKSPVSARGETTADSCHSPEKEQD